MAVKPIRPAAAPRAVDRQRPALASHRRRRLHLFFRYYQPQIYRLNHDLTNLKVIITGVRLPRGLHVRGSGADKTIYFAAATSVFRAKIGTADVFTGTPEKVLEAHTYVRDVVLDDENTFYVSQRTSNDPNADPAGNIVWWENGDEHNYMFSPPRPNKYATPNPPGQEIKVGTTAVDTKNTTSIPGAFVLYPAHPNPFNPSTKIRFDLAKSAPVLLRIFDLSGREIAVIMNDRLQAGQHGYLWDARQVPSGVYLYRLEALGYSATRRVTLIK